MSATDSRQVVGDFYAEITARLLINLEEGVFGGDHKTDAILKALTTSQKVGINEKYLPRYQLRSFHRWIITSNQFQPTKATTDERRWFILAASDARLGDKAYFNALYHEMENGGPAALLAYLQAFDISGIDVRRAPRTEEATEQIIETLEGAHAWWRDIVQSGKLPQGCHLGGRNVGDRGAGRAVRATASRLDQWQAARRWGAGEHVSPEMFGKILLKYGLIRKRDGGGARGWRYIIPPLPDCEATFIKATSGAPPDPVPDPDLLDLL